ncbi:sugar phosphate isomerase/epimerase family protein [Saccharibacillus sp. CPCC 101409]|uniref:sugar phosphate isomerase/epimerase family protein n=1 Tax=Saccharibacillus sp. CPCC 101409 TaxID=3058041 RepID=UPI002673E9DD|nr:sugar phosphate isomerase/epimerase family protein [Saccharibacillus sp. CPCC 101409]MDO3408409.1 sugar phosphate isomerase/epimerase family protein [Saccharibacillus sp. CPCC 101409]
MERHIRISGFSDEISSDFDTQLEVVTRLGMRYLSLRGIDGRNVGDFTVEEIQENVLPRLQKAGVGVSSIGSPIGKVFVGDEEGFANQQEMLHRLCRIGMLLGCRYIRIFSFYIPAGRDPDAYRDEVIAKIGILVRIAERYDIVLLHENEKDIYGDIAERCADMFTAVDSEHFKAIFDFANFVQCGEDTQNCYELLKPHIAYIHIKDAVSTDRENVLCGAGEGQIPSILAQAIAGGYTGFLTLEPHLVLFDSLKDLELEPAEHVIKDNKGLDGAGGYRLQYEALKAILKQIESGATVS